MRARARRHVFALDELSASGRWDEPLRLALRGRAAAVSVRSDGRGRAARDCSRRRPRRGRSPSTSSSSTRGCTRAAQSMRRRRGTVRLRCRHRGPRAGRAAAGYEAAALRRCGAARHGRRGGGRNRVRRTARRAGQVRARGASRVYRLGGARPRVSGALTFGDARSAPVPRRRSRRRRLGHRRELERASLPLRDLVPVDVDVDLSVAQWLGLPGDLRDARLELRADAGGVRAPIGATIAGIPFSGRLDLDTAAPTPILAVRLDAKDAALGDSRARSAGATRHRRHVRAHRPAPRRPRRNARGAGARPRAGARGGGRTIALRQRRRRTLDRLHVRHARRCRAPASACAAARAARCTASARPSRSAAARCPTCCASRAMPVELDLAAAHAKLRIEGTLALAGATGETDLAFGLRRPPRRGPRAVARRRAEREAAARPARPRADRTADAWHLDATTLRARPQRADDRRPSHDRWASDRSPSWPCAARSSTCRSSRRSPRAAARASRGPRHRRHRCSRTARSLADADIELGLQRVALGRIDLVRRRASPPASATDACCRHRSPPSSRARRSRGSSRSTSRGEVPEATLDRLRRCDRRRRAAAGPGRRRGHRRSRGRIAGSTLRARGSTLREPGGALVVRGARDRRQHHGARRGGPPGRRDPSCTRRSSVRWRAGPSGFGSTARSTRHRSRSRSRAARSRISRVTRRACRLPSRRTRPVRASRSRATALLPLGRGGKLTFAMSGERLDTLNGSRGWNSRRGAHGRFAGRSG